MKRTERSWFKANPTLIRSGYRFIYPRGHFPINQNRIPAMPKVSPWSGKRD